MTGFTLSWTIIGCLCELQIDWAEPSVFEINMLVSKLISMGEMLTMVLFILIPEGQR